MTKQQTVLVSGATGNQGGAVSKALINNHHKVYALTRNKQSPAAKALEALGAELVEGCMDEPSSIIAPLKKVNSFFLMGNPMEKGTEHEVTQGIALANAAKSANIGHLVYSSVANADCKTGIPQFESKYRIEQHIKSLGIPHTICAPVAFMDNVFAPWAIDIFKAGKISQALPDNISLQQISLKNIGAFVTSIFEKREAVFGERFDIAGDEVNGSEMANILSYALQKKIAYESFPTSVLEEFAPDMAIMFEWLSTTGYKVNITKLQAEFSDIDWQTYSQWAEDEKWSELLK